MPAPSSRPRASTRASALLPDLGISFQLCCLPHGDPHGPLVWRLFPGWSELLYAEGFGMAPATWWAPWESWRRCHEGFGNLHRA